MTVSSLKDNSAEISDVNLMFDEIYDSTYKDVYIYVLSKVRNPSDTDDIVQTAYIKFYKRLQNGGEIKEPIKYLVTTAKNEIFKNYKILDRLSKNIPVFSKTDDENFEAVELELLDDDTDEINGLILEEVWKFLKNGDTVTYKIFVLYFEYDKKFREIAEILDLNESTVKSKLFRTLKQIRENYGV